jgi:hypothetical protein
MIAGEWLAGDRAFEGPVKILNVFSACLGGQVCQNVAAGRPEWPRSTTVNAVARFPAPPCLKPEHPVVI